LYLNGTFEIQELRKSEEKLKGIVHQWNQMLVHAADDLPNFLHFDE
jgi:hypothetical protein